MKDKCFERLSFGTWGLGLLGIIVCIILYLITDDSISKFLSANKFLLTSFILFVIGVISSCFYMRCSKAETTLTEKQVIDCIKKAISEETKIKIDESVVSRIEAKLEEIQKQQSAFESTLYEKLENAFFTKNSNMKFLQDMAASISNKDNAWTNEQIERFLKCMESINDMMKKEK